MVGPNSHNALGSWLVSRDWAERQALQSPACPLALPQNLVDTTSFKPTIYCHAWAKLSGRQPPVGVAPDSDASQPENLERRLSLRDGSIQRPSRSTGRGFDPQPHGWSTTVRQFLQLRDF